MINRLTAGEYAQLLGRLLPRGRIWQARTGGEVEDVNEASGVELNRAHDRAVDLLDESDPRTADEMLDAWERVAGLPDPNAPAPATTADRQAALHAKVTATGGQSPAYYIAQALAHGFTITITEWPYGVTLRSETGRSEDRALGTFGMFYWQVNASATLTADERTQLEAMINRLRPAHTIPIFVYS